MKVRSSARRMPLEYLGDLPQGLHLQSGGGIALPFNISISRQASICRRVTDLQAPSLNNSSDRLLQFHLDFVVLGISIIASGNPAVS